MVEVFVMDGKTWNIKILSILQKASVLDTENSGRGVNGDMIRDVIGTFYNYTMKIKPDKKNPNEYDAFFEAITSPVDFHNVALPHGQGMLVFDAYVTSAERNLKYKNLFQTKWGETTINFIAKQPQIRKV